MLGSCVLDRDSHQSLDEFIKNDLAGNGLQGLDDGRQVQPLNGVSDNGVRGWTDSILWQAEMIPVDVPNFAQGTQRFQQHVPPMAGFAITLAQDLTDERLKRPDNGAYGMSRSPIGKGTIGVTGQRMKKDAGNPRLVGRRVPPRQ